MNVGIFLFATPYTAHPADVAIRAEALGFDSLWMGEHPVMPVSTSTPYPLTEDGTIPDFYGQLADPLIGLATAAASTKRIKIGTGVCLVTERDPIILAKEIATLDHLSDGRVVLGVGSGWLKEEVEILGTSFSKRWLRLRESIEAMRRLWTVEEASYHGQIIDFPPVRCNPKPVQKPHPPVLLGAHGEKGLRRVAAWADGWCPLAPGPQALRKQLVTLRRYTEEAGRNFSTLEISVFLGIRDEDPCADLIQQYEDAGADRVVLMLGAESGALAFRHVHFLEPQTVEGTLERLAKNALS